MWTISALSKKCYQEMFTNKLLKKITIQFPGQYKVKILYVIANWPAEYQNNVVSW